MMDNDTICALATPAGGAIAIVRLSGGESVGITEKVFRSASGKSLSQALPNTIHYGEIVDKEGKTIDDVLVSVFRAPHSYTGEDSVEISCHGSRYIVSLILRTLIDNGCRQAEPGEYTKRAYLNGKMDLSQAEAVADLIAATNSAMHKMALSQLKGHFSSELSVLREQLLHITTLMELELDFSDHEELEFADRSELLDLARNIDDRIMRLARSFETGNAIKQGVPVVIVGKTNVGKSTLLNKLLQEERAIVSEVHGTTRDVIEDTKEIHGITFRFIDTAGLRHTEDQVEQMGIERTYGKLKEASVVLWLVDEKPTSQEIEDMRRRSEGKHLLVVRNKVDLSTESLPDSVIGISAKQGIGIDNLEEALYKAADIPEIKENDVIVTSVRHYEALTRAHEAISRVKEDMQAGLSGDLVSEDLRVCLDALSEITGGTITPQEVLNNVFKHFCIGK